MWARLKTDGTIDALYAEAPADGEDSFVPVPDHVLADWTLVEGTWQAPAPSEEQPVPPGPTPEDIKAVLMAAGMTEERVAALFAAATAL